VDGHRNAHSAWPRLPRRLPVGHPRPLPL